MPLSAAAFAGEVATVTVKTNQGEAHIRYYPNAMTPKRARLLQAMGDDDENDEQYILLFCEMVADLDMAGPLYDYDDLDEAGNPRQVVGEGDPVPVEPEYVSLLPLKLLKQIMDAMQNDMNAEAPKATTGRKSSMVSRNGSRI